YEEICAMEVPGAMVLAKNVAIKRLTYLVLQFFSKYHGYRESGRYLTIGAGELGEINLKSLLGKLDDAKFSGRLLVRINSQETRIHFQDGKISGMLPVAYPGNESLKAILSSKNGDFRVEQAIVQWDELIHQNNQDISLENRDVLVDMFYYIHRHFDDIGRGELFLEKAAGDNLHRRWLADHGIFLSINTASHEKLDILGHLDESGITRIVAWLASLFEDIVESQEAFAAFFSGLAEIRQFVTSLPGMADFAVPPSPEPVPLQKLEPKTPAARALFASVQSGKVIPKVLESL
ncbi:MAG: DUF4388 domain-containing protein, partial [Calditrichaeota bacterium]|nr:DUF4388 domain-containing protein [Calditrichota bacterium]